MKVGWLLRGLAVVRLFRPARTPEAERVRNLARLRLVTAGDEIVGDALGGVSPRAAALSTADVPLPASVERPRGRLVKRLVKLGATTSAVVLVGQMASPAPTQHGDTVSVAEPLRDPDGARTTRASLELILTAPVVPLSDQAVANERLRQLENLLLAAPRDADAPTLRRLLVGVLLTGTREQIDAAVRLVEGADLDRATRRELLFKSFASPTVGRRIDALAASETARWRRPARVVLPPRAARPARAARSAVRCPVAPPAAVLDPEWAPVAAYAECL